MLKLTNKYGVNKRMLKSHLKNVKTRCTIREIGEYFDIPEFVCWGIIAQWELKR